MQASRIFLKLAAVQGPGSSCQSSWCFNRQPRPRASTMSNLFHKANIFARKNSVPVFAAALQDRSGLPRVMSSRLPASAAVSCCGFVLRAINSTIQRRPLCYLLARDWDKDWLWLRISSPSVRRDKFSLAASSHNALSIWTLLRWQIRRNSLPSFNTSTRQVLKYSALAIRISPTEPLVVSMTRHANSRGTQQKSSERNT